MLDDTSITNSQQATASETLKRIVREYGIYLAFVLLVIVLSFANKYFLTQSNISNVLLQTSINGVLAFGMTFVIITGGIDLSVGSVLALAGIVSASFATNSPQATVAGGPYPVFVALTVGVLVGVASGAIIGPIVARFHVPAFVATLGMLSAARGLTLIYAGGRPVPALTHEYRWIGNGALFGVRRRSSFSRRSSSSPGSCSPGPGSAATSTPSAATLAPRRLRASTSWASASRSTSSAAPSPASPACCSRPAPARR